MDLTGSKVVALCIMLVGVLVFGLAPIWVGKALGSQQLQFRRTLTSILLCFGGGVLFSTVFTHILPEVIEGFATFEDLEEKPVGEICLCAGFFFIYFVEELVHHIGADRIAGHNHGAPARTLSRRSLRSSSSSSSSSDSDRKGDTYKTFSKDGESDRLSTQAEEWTFCSSEGLRDFMTVLALCFHSVFEGLALGLADEDHEVWELLGALCAHKFVIAFSLGMELVEARTKLTFHFLYIITFACMGALGVGIGIGVSQAAAEGKAYTATNATLNALAAGTLLYVALFEILQRERQAHRTGGLVQLLACVVGFSCMMLVDLLAPNHHGDDEEEAEEENMPVEDSLVLGGPSSPLSAISRKYPALTAAASALLGSRESPQT